MATLTAASRVPTPRRTGTARLVVGYLTVLAILPYLLLKLVWVGGGEVGISDTGKADDPTLLALNALTLGMDLVAVAVVLAFTHSWGLRVPAWAVLPPTWVGTGLLVPIVLSAPPVAIAALWDTGTAPAGGIDFLQAWVQPVVYTSFTAQGLGIVVAFLLYARSRWPRAFTTRVGSRPLGPTQPVYVVGGRLAAVLTGAAAAVQLLWAAGSTLGLPAAMVAETGVSHHVTNLVSGLLAVAAVAGLLTLVRRRGTGTPLWVPLVATWTGAGAMWAWGTWGLAMHLSQPPMAAAGGAGLLPWQNLVGMLAGMLVAMVGLLVTVEALASGQSSTGSDTSWSATAKSR